MGELLVFDWFYKVSGLCRSDPGIPRGCQTSPGQDLPGRGSVGDQKLERGRMRVLVRGAFPSRKATTILTSLELEITPPFQTNPEISVPAGLTNRRGGGLFQHRRLVWLAGPERDILGFWPLKISIFDRFYKGFRHGGIRCDL